MSNMGYWREGQAEIPSREGIRDERTESVYMRFDMTGFAAIRRRRWMATAAAAAIATLTGCSSWTGLLGGNQAPPTTPSTSAPPEPATPAPASSTASFTTRVRSFFSGNSTSLPAAAPTPGAPRTPEVDCPSVTYRQGAVSYALNSQGAENAALNLRYQASFIQTARECVVSGNEVTIKVGVQGRVVVGPAGGPGQVTIPLRYALVREGLEPQTLWTKFFPVPVTVPEGQLNVPWLHVEQEMTVPLPADRDLDAYVIYVGFDPDSLTPAKPAPSRPRSARVR
jgi:hypothetical protein